MGWYDHIKSYVWDDRTTPYLVPVPRLTQPQADKELFSYATFVAFIYGSGVVASLLQARIQGQVLFYAAAVYCVTVAAAGIHVSMTKNAHTARYLVGAPLLALVAFVSGAVNPNLHPLETVGLAVICLVWLRYTFRVVAITQAYPNMSEQLPPNIPPPSNPRQR